MGSGKDEHMSLKIIGATCIFAACGACGFAMAAQHMGKIRRLQNLLSAVDYMECELQCRCTPLPQLCRQAGHQSRGKVQQILIMLADELDAQISPNVQRCMASVMDRVGDLEKPLTEALTEFGRNLGKFDLSGQMQGLHNTRIFCEEMLQRLMMNKDSRLRSYQTLGLCAGAAIVILFM